MVGELVEGTSVGGEVGRFEGATVDGESVVPLTVGSRLAGLLVGAEVGVTDGFLEGTMEGDEEGAYVIGFDGVNCASRAVS